jgi:hypothetical protein
MLADVVECRTGLPSLMSDVGSAFGRPWRGGLFHPHASGRDAHSRPRWGLTTSLPGPAQDPSRSLEAMSISDQKPQWLERTRSGFVVKI